jgi:hypothetical protein
MSLMTDQYAGRLRMPARGACHGRQLTPSTESRQRQVLIGIPVANPVFVAQWKSLCNQRLSASTGLRIPRALFWQCTIGIFYTRLERISSARSGDQELRYSIPPLNDSCKRLSPPSTSPFRTGYFGEIALIREGRTLRRWEPFPERVSAQEFQIEALGGASTRPISIHVYSMLIVDRC